MPPKVVITDSTYPDASIEREELADVGATVELANARTPAAVIEFATDADALLNQETELPAAVFESLDELEVVARYGVGVDNIDLDAAAAHDVSVLNVPSYCESEVATHALTLLLACRRRVPLYDDRVKGGQWDWKDGRPISALEGSTVGFVAFGNIAQKFDAMLDGMPVETVAYDPYQSEEVFRAHDVEPVSFEALLERADCVSVHAPLTEETRGLFDAAAFERMNDDAVLVNVARGPVVDDEVLADALRAGELAGAGLDVLPEEPPESSPLFDIDEVVLTPHVAWYSESSMETLRRRAGRGVAACLRGERPDNLVVE
ncbi:MULTISPECIES: C-terminal binding protein [Haloarcula]|uniref:C-terminal binding protein n=1 Tax=Haloarcula TaxID=2237 RepID=UPI0023EBDE4A|nr:C-terminal binding protein [Halomicroarcula sp. XH51]